MPKYRVTIGASPNGSQGALYWIKREYEIEVWNDAFENRSAIIDAAIKRAYEDGDIEHVRVEKIVMI